MNDTIPSILSVYDEKQHNRLLRLFKMSSILSAVIILSLVGLGSYSVFRHFILLEAVTDAITIGRALLEQEKDTLIGPELKEAINISEEEFPHFDQHIQKSLDLFRMSKLKIYSKDKMIVYSTDHTIIGKSDHENELLEAALNGDVVSEFERENKVWDLEDEQKFKLDMVETYLPIKDMNNMVVGAFEIYMDFSPYRLEIRKVLTLSLGTLFVILLCVFGGLIYFMRRATNTIYSKTLQLRILHGLLPICSYCKKIRNNEGGWEIIEEYIPKRSESEFTHGICPECKEKHFPGRGGKSVS